MRKERRNLGFTMAELLIVVAIIVILGGVGFIAVQAHQRSMTQLERDAIAKEIFVAAQNHLTMAESQGYLSDGSAADFFGTPEAAVTTEMGKTYNNVYSFTNADLSQGKLLDLMLPFGAIDETVRSGGSYIIRYQSNPALVLDVFYCPTSSGERFTYDLSGASYADLEEYAGADVDRKHCVSDSVLGWYGGAPAQDSGITIAAPTLEIYNAERLTVLVADPNYGIPVSDKDTSALASLKLIVTGEDSGAKAAFLLDATNLQTDRVIPDKDNRGNAKGPDSTNHIKYYTVVLDDITKGVITSGNDRLHFADLNNYTDPSNGKLCLEPDATGTYTTLFYPGENITVQAVAYSNKALTNIAYSAERTTNSLFADLDASTAMIDNFRHLENLDASVSKLSEEMSITAANQIVDLSDPESSANVDVNEYLSWTGFVNEIKKVNGVDVVRIFNAEGKGTKDNCYLPVNPSYVTSDDDGDVEIAVPLIYEGNSHSITGVKVDTISANTDAAAITNGGLFGSLTGGTVQNLELIDFSVNLASSDAGALAGALTDCTVSNVVAYNTTNATTVNIATASGSAGGLVGSMTGTDLEKCAAALIVNSASGNAGGLVGTSNGGSITGCYAGGHTVDKPLASGAKAVVYSDADYNVTATVGNAGGLIGFDVSTPITSSYSTCSVKGDTAGGLVASATANITSCYAVGRIYSDATDSVTPVGQSEAITLPKAGAFAYSLTGTASDCHYYEIINEIPLTDDNSNITDYHYLTALGENKEKTGITPLDADMASYDEFVGRSPTEDEARDGLLKAKDETKLWTPASPYDATLLKYYGGEYPLKTVEQLGATVQHEVKDDDGNITITPADFVSIHYGDWPAPEIFVINVK